MCADKDGRQLCLKPRFLTAQNQEWFWLAAHFELMINYRQLVEQITQNLEELEVFTYVGTTARPPDTLASTFSNGLPAALIRLLSASLTAEPDQEILINYNSLVRVEFTLLADPRKIEIARWNDIITTAMYLAINTDGGHTANLIDQSSVLGENLEYRFVVSYKVSENLTLVIHG